MSALFLTHPLHFMATELLRTPIVEVRWCQLLGNPRSNKFDPTKNPTWQIEILLENDNTEHVAWFGSIEAAYETLHPGEKRHTHWLPIKPDKKQPKTRHSCRFKLPQFTYEDGNKSEGPVVYDAQGNYWPAKKLIGNGSKMRIGFDIYAWKAPTGAGMTLQPRAAQVIEWIAAPTTKPTSAADFGFYVTPASEDIHDQIPF